MHKLPDQVLIWSTDELQARYLQQVYQAAGFDVRLCKGYHQLKALAQAHKHQPLALVLSLARRPELTHKHLRQLHQQLPLAVLMVISPYQDPELNQAVLQAGADDCLVQPLDARDIVGRTQARLKRTQTILQALWRPKVTEKLQFGLLHLHPETREAKLAQQSVRLTLTEFALLHLLAQHANQRLTRAQIYQQLWQIPEAPGSRRLDNFVLNLRKKLAVLPDLELLTYYGEGFCLKLEC